MPPDNSTINIETVQHPTLGPLKFPSDMPYEQRNQLIESLEAEQKASTKTDGPQLGSRSQPRIANGQGDAITIGARILGQRPPILQPYPSQVGTGTTQPDAASNRLPHALSFGAPPDRASSNDSTLGSRQYAEPTNSLLPARSPQGFLFGNDERNSFGSSGTDGLNQAGSIGGRILSVSTRNNQGWAGNSGSPWTGTSPQQDDRSLFARGTQGSEPSAIQRNRYLAGLSSGRDFLGDTFTDPQRGTTAKTGQTTKPGTSPTPQARGNATNTETSGAGRANQASRASSGLERTNEYVPPELRAGLRKSELGKMNMRAAIPYLINRAIQEYGLVAPPASDNGRQEVFTKKDGTLTNFARRFGTTVQQLYNDNPGLEQNVNSLRPNTPLKVRIAKESPVWRDWNDAAKLYNNKTANYRDQVVRNYEIIKQIWPQ